MVVPPWQLQLMWRILAWRLPAQYRPWLAADIHSSHFRWYSPTRIVLWAAEGACLGVIADELILIHPVWHLRRFLIPAVVIAAISAVQMSSSVVTKLRARSERWQGLTGGALRGSNRVRLAVIAAFQALALVLAVSNAEAAHGKVCGGGASTAEVPLQGLVITSPAGLNPVPASAGSGLGPQSNQDVAANAKSPSAAKQILSCNGFESAYNAAWSARSPNRGVLVKLYQFSSTSGAKHYRDLDERGTWKNVIHTGPPATLDGDPPPALLPVTKDPFGNNIGYQFVAVNRFVFVVRMFRNDRPVTAEDLHPVVAAQTALLAA